MKTPILLIMFTRWSTLEKVFQQVKLAQPERLYLYQDGPRRESYSEDMEGINRCREIVSNIDWNCKVITKYMESNQGCDPGSYYAYKWFFSMEDKGIILEDDAVASLSFFKYCEELLDRFENNNLIYRICGANVEGISNTGNSYFYSRKGSTGSWATWSRVAEMWDEHYSFLDNAEELRLLEKRFENHDYYNSWLKGAIAHKSTGVPYYETIFYENKIASGMLDVIPDRNLVTNIGLTNDAVHNNSLRFMPKAIKKYFNAERYDLEFPLKHPDIIEENMHYTNSVNRMMGWGHPFLRTFRKFETAMKRLILGNKEDRKYVFNKIKEITTYNNHE